MTGFSEYFGSCMIMDMRRPRIARICAALACRRSTSANCKRVASTFALRGCSPSKALPTVDLPEPDSPTMPSFSRPSANETPRTALEVLPSGEVKCTRRSCTCKRGESLEVVMCASISWCLFAARVQYVIQAIAQQVERQTDQQDGTA